MKLLTFYSDTHKEIYENHFLSSFNIHLSSEFTLLPLYIEQKSISGDYGSKGFAHTMLDKINHIIDNIDIRDSEPMVFADCDIQFFGPMKDQLLSEIADYDIAFQNDITCLCAGFFIAKQNVNILNYFNQVKTILINLMDKGVDDQQVINGTINKTNLRYNRLSNLFWTVTMSTGPKQWTGEDFILSIPILVHHANWTVGVANKIRLLNLVREKRILLNEVIL